MRTKILFGLGFYFITVLSFSQSFTGKLGYGLSPAGFPNDYSQIPAFLQEAGQMCNGNGVVFQNAEWRDNSASSGIIPAGHKAISQNRDVYGYTDMLGFGWGHYPDISLDVTGDATKNWTNATAKALFLQMLINAADSLQPAYLFIGNEINFYYQDDSLDFPNFVNFYHQAYDSIKAHSPNTKVGTNFNYEHLSGQGVLTGWNTSYWNAFNLFDTTKIDVFSFTLYPFFQYSTANSVPTNYLDGIFNKIGNKPLVISETGWPADSLIGTWASSPVQQVDYVNKLFSMVQGKNVEVINWLFLNYLMSQANDGFKIFCSVSMRDSVGNDRPALPVWLSYCESTTSIVETADQDNTLKIYPNPFNTFAILQLDRIISNGEISIYNVFGQKVSTINNISDDKIKIQRDNLPVGVYFILLTENNKIISTGNFLISNY